MASGAILLHWIQDSYFSETYNEDTWENVSWPSFQDVNVSKYDDFSNPLLYFNNAWEYPQPFSHKAVNFITEYLEITLTSTASHLGLISGFVLAVLFNAQLYSVKKNKFLQYLQNMVLRSLFAALCLVLTLMAAPVVGIIMLFLALFRQGIHIFLKFTQPYYVELFEGVDAIWAVEGEATRSIINVLAFVEVEDLEQGKSLLHAFRKTVLERLATPPIPCPKLFYLRRQCLGYYYWEYQEELNMEEYIRPMVTVTHETEQINYNDNEITEEILKNVVGAISNTTLPRNHAACWEVLVGTQSIANASNKEGNELNEHSEKMLQYPVMFRVHHALGDGISLMQLLVSAMADILPHTSPSGAKFTESPVLPTMPMPTRKFHNTFFSEQIEESNSVDLQIVSTEEHCSKLKSYDPVYNQYCAQSLPILNSSEVRVSADRNHVPFEHTESFNISVEALKDKADQRREQQRANEISIDLQNIEEYDQDDQQQVDSSNIIEDTNTSTQPRQTMCFYNKQNHSISIQCKQPTIFKNNSGTPDQSKSYCIPQCQLQSHKNKSVYENEGPCPTPQQKFKSAYTERSYSDPKTTSSSHQPLTHLNTSIFSQSSNPNFQTSLPVLNLCQSPRKKTAVSKLPLNSAVTTSTDHYKSESNLINHLQINKCTSSIVNKTSLEEPQSLFNKTKQISLHSLPQNHNPSPHIQKLRSSKSMTLHCYNHTMPESYITIPEELVCSDVKIDKASNTSIYFYSPAVTPVTNNLCSPKSTVSEANLSPATSPSDDKLSKNCKGYIHTISSSSESSFEEINYNEGKISPTSIFLPPHSIKYSVNSMDENAVQLNLNNLCVKDRKEPRKSKSDGNLTGLQQPHSPGIQAQSLAILNPYCTKKVISNCNKEQQNMSVRREFKQIERNTNTIRNIELNLESQEKQTTNSLLGKPKLNCDKEWKWKNREQTMTKNESVMKLPSNNTNQFVELLNTISNSNNNITSNDSHSKFVQTIGMLALSPASLIHQAIMKAIDTNALHGPPLTGYKVTGWYRDPNGDLFKSIKRVKNQSNTRFTEVFLTALSASLETYFENHKIQCTDNTPEIVTVVIPARMEPLESMSPEVIRQNRTLCSDSTTIPQEDVLQVLKNKTSKACREENGLQHTPTRHVKDRECNIDSNRIHKDFKPTFSLSNNFSVAMLQLPIRPTDVSNSEGKNSSSKFSFANRLTEVHKQYQLLRNSVDYQVNYWMLKIVATFLPAKLLAAVVNSSQSSLVVSNIMGPTKELSFTGNKFKDIMFWVPHRGSTGIGITALSYMGRLQIGIMADRALIHCKEDAQMILDQAVAEIYKLDQDPSLPA